MNLLGILIILTFATCNINGNLVVNDEHNFPKLVMCQPYGKGSTIHYYHFFYACLIPIIEYQINNKFTQINLIADCGPFHKILDDLPLNIKSIYSPIQYETQSNKQPYITLPSYDTFENLYFTNTSIKQFHPLLKTQIIQFFDKTLTKHSNLYKTPTAKIILIERATDKYHQINGITSGSTRRSIKNHNELYNTLLTRYGNNIMNIKLEKQNIYYQYRIFKYVDIVIGQHGAALSNIFFMRSNTSVIEISPPYNRNAKYFSNLIQYMNITYYNIKQETNHGNVDIDLIIKYIDCILFAIKQNTISPSNCYQR
jgi:hypothetical protein